MDIHLSECKTKLIEYNITTDLSQLIQTVLVSGLSKFLREALFTFVGRSQKNVRLCVCLCVRKILEIMHWGNEGWTHADPLRK